ncbi:MAG: Maf-like protein [Clostridium sp.]|uniref:Maf-like protein n=1 Tax=Clostridium sp. DSM 8431 TaxID=1761781 RepID=UPI0008DEBF33|nr:Maf-like protein [Clostridium sp. DSM 8431]MCR4943205.1 Maf-like protein [Clostridium sp.]SFU50292.1 septum formation protein [Clostridium sp. DSM 8431]
MNFILASASERRQELLKRIVNNFTVLVSDFDESIVKNNGNVSEYVQELALGKAKDVKLKIKEPSIIIAADTVVSLDEKILGKPKDRDDAYRMLSSLSGNVHKVYTGVVVINTETNTILKDFVETKVFFSELTREEINTYIDSGDPFDKAGSYGIQGRAGVFVEKIEGCYYNVVGLPLNKLNKMIKKVC